MASYQRGETYQHKVSIRTDATLVDPDSITIDISDPCSTATVSAAAMSKLSTGVYNYSYQIPALAAYGEYSVEVDVTIGN